MGLLLCDGKATGQQVSGLGLSDESCSTHPTKARWEAKQVKEKQVTAEDTRLEFDVYCIRAEVGSHCSQHMAMSKSG